ncbi:unnamed protein product, partial [Mesorhabditis spiculigera]
MVSPSSSSASLSSVSSWSSDVSTANSHTPSSHSTLSSSSHSSHTSSITSTASTESEGFPYLLASCFTGPLYKMAESSIPCRHAGFLDTVDLEDERVYDSDEALLSLPDKLFDAVTSTLDASTLLAIANVSPELRARIEYSPKSWQWVEQIPNGYFIDYNCCTMAEATILLQNSTVPPRYVDGQVYGRQLSNMPIVLLRIIADHLEDKDFVNCLKACPTFLSTGRRASKFGLSRVTIRARLQPDGTKKTRIRIEGTEYDAQLTAYLLNNAKLVATLIFDPTINAFPDTIKKMPECEMWHMMPVRSGIEVWPEVLDFLKQSRVLILQLDGWPHRYWEALLRDAGFTKERPTGWIVATKLEAVAAKHLPLLLQIRGPHALFHWDPSKEDAQARWSFLDQLMARPLEDGQSLMILFEKPLEPDQLNPNMFAGVTMEKLMVKERMRGYTLNTPEQPYSLQIYRSRLILMRKDPGVGDDGAAAEVA